MENNKRKRIGIDARFYGPLGKGLGRYTKELVDRVTALDGHHDYTIFLHPKNFDEFVVTKPNVRKVMAGVRWYTAAEQIEMPRLIRRERIDLMHFPHFNVPLFCPAKFVVTIHDLILTQYPTRRASTLSPLAYKLKNLGYHVTIRTALRRARKIIAVSEFTKSDIMKKFKVPGERIAVTYEGVAAAVRQPVSEDDKKALLRYNIKAPYLLYVGNVYPHKNIERLGRVFLKISGKFPDWQLVLVGKSDYFYERAKKNFTDAVKNEKIIFPGFVPDRILAVFYQAALAYVFPSLYEGFGLPPLEAMAHGCPVVSSRLSSLPEILGPAALYFDPENEEDMGDKIVRAATDGGLRANLIGRGHERIKLYSWDRCASETLAIYNSVN